MHMYMFKYAYSSTHIDTVYIYTYMFCKYVVGWVGCATQMMCEKIQ
jgi:hypothetical protein